jgi:hypothetical protein
LGSQPRTSLALSEFNLKIFDSGRFLFLSMTILGLLNFQLYANFSASVLTSISFSSKGPKLKELKISFFS